MKLDFETRMSILSEFLSGYYVVESDGYIVSSETDCVVYNVMTFDGKDVIHWDEETEEYYTDKDVLHLPVGDGGEEEDVVCNEWYGDYYSDCGECGESYKECEDYTIVWIHPVKSGSVTLEVDTGMIYGDENTKYDTPYCYVIINNECHTLDTRYRYLNNTGIFM